MAGRLGLEIDLAKVPAEGCSDLEVLFSESNSRFVATVAPEHKAAFEAALAGIPFAEVGKVIAEPELILAGRSGKYTVTLDALLKEYKGTLDQI